MAGNTGIGGAAVKTYRILKLQTLIDKKACPQKVKLFRSMFGDSVRVTEKRCVSVADKFDFTWAAIHLLSALARADYNRAVAAAFARAYLSRAAQRRLP